MFLLGHKVRYLFFTTQVHVKVWMFPTCSFLSRTLTTALTAWNQVLLPILLAIQTLKAAINAPRQLIMPILLVMPTLTAALTAQTQLLLPILLAMPTLTTVLTARS